MSVQDKLKIVTSPNQSTQNIANAMTWFASWFNVNSRNCSESKCSEFVNTGGFEAMVNLLKARKNVTDVGWVIGVLIFGRDRFTPQVPSSLMTMMVTVALETHDEEKCERLMYGIVNYIAFIIPHIKYFFEAKGMDLFLRWTPATLPKLQNDFLALADNLAIHDEWAAEMKKTSLVDKLIEISKTDISGVNTFRSSFSLANLVGREMKSVTTANRKFIDGMLVALDAAARHTTVRSIGNVVIAYRVWKVSKAFSNLAINDTNLNMLAETNIVSIYGTVLRDSKHLADNQCIEHVFLALWNLSFNEKMKQQMLADSNMVEKAKQFSKSEHKNTKVNAEGLIFNLGLREKPKKKEVEKKSDDGKPEEKQKQIMLSYNWDAQETVLKIKNSLEAKGYKVWMDVDQMSGSTLEAMANAVEESDVVCIGMTKKYKESANCRTEAEYAFQLKKKIIPLHLQPGYKAEGWLGALLGSKLWFEFHDVRGNALEQKMAPLCKELENFMGSKPAAAQGASTSTSAPAAPVANADFYDWNSAKVKEWLKKNKADHLYPQFEKLGLDNGMALDAAKSYMTVELVAGVQGMKLGEAMTVKMLVDRL